MAAEPVGDGVVGAELRAQLTANLATLERYSVELDGRRHAAVAVVVVDGVAGSDEGPGVLITRRAVGLRTHARQWALPGGRIDPGETPIDAARRELEEELGLALPADAVLGLLDDYPTRSGFVISPVVLWAGHEPTIRPHAGEVESVHHVSFRELCRPDSPQFVAIEESPRPVVQVLVGDTRIHAPTGAVLLQFRRVAIEGTIERVHEYEQPVFAWR